MTQAQPNLGDEARINIENSQFDQALKIDEEIKLRLPDVESIDSNLTETVNDKLADYFVVVGIDDYHTPNEVLSMSRESTPQSTDDVPVSLDRV